MLPNQNFASPCPGCGFGHHLDVAHVLPASSGSQEQVLRRANGISRAIKGQTQPPDTVANGGHPSKSIISWRPGPRTFRISMTFVISKLFLQSPRVGPKLLMLASGWCCHCSRLAKHHGQSQAVTSKHPACRNSFAISLASTAAGSLEFERTYLSPNRPNRCKAALCTRSH